MATIISIKIKITFQNTMQGTGGHEACQPLKGHSPLRRLALPILLSPFPFQTKNEPSMKDSYTLPEFVQKNQGFQIWRNAFGDKNGAQAKQKVDAY